VIDMRHMRAQLMGSSVTGLSDTQASLVADVSTTA